MTAKTAILIFSRSAQAENAAKQFLTNEERNLNTAKVLIQGVSETVTNTGLPYFFVDELQQKGNTFGEKFAHAFQLIYDKGFENVISVGNDSPNLTSEILNQAKQHVENGQIAIGPNWNEGVYLIGLNKAQFKATLFQELPWQTTQLSKALFDYTQNQYVNPTYLDKLYDINSELDLLNYLQTTKVKDEIYKLLFALVFPKQVNEDNTTKHFYFPEIDDVSTLRGPPLVFFSNN